MAKEYGIVVLTKDRLTYLQELIKSIKENTSDYQLVVVDDVSSDDTEQWLKKQSFLAVFHNKSVSVAKAWNEGAYLLNTKYLVFLNDDMLVTADWLEEQKKLYERLENVGSLSFEVLNKDGNSDVRGWRFDGSQGSEENPVIDWAPFPFIKRDIFEKVGGFSEMGQIYFEDTDLGFKLQKAGYKNYYNPQAKIYHFQVSSDYREINNTIHWKKSQEKFLKKWGDYLKNVSPSYRQQCEKMGWR